MAKKQRANCVNLLEDCSKLVHDEDCIQRNIKDPCASCRFWEALQQAIFIGEQDIYTDAWEYADRVEQMRAAIKAIAKVVRT